MVFGVCGRTAYTTDWIAPGATSSSVVFALAFRGKELTSGISLGVDCFAFPFWSSNIQTDHETASHSQSTD